MGISRRQLLASSALAGLAACGSEEAPDAGRSAPSSAPGAGGSASGAGGSAAGVSLRWLGNNAWDIRFGSTTILIDPWLTRFKTGTYTPEGIRPDTPLSSDPAKIDPHVGKADLILVGHGHYDHITDVPYIAKKTGAKVLGTESHLNMLKALSVPNEQTTTVKAGTRLEFAGYTVEVFHALHALSGQPPQVPFPGTRLGAVPPRPMTVADLVEGETLAYLITVDGRFRILALSTGNFDEQALAGVRPDLAIVAAGGERGYAGRLMGVIGNPKYVLPTHWDDFDVPLDEPARDWGGLTALQQAVAAASPGTKFVKLEHLQTFTPS